MVAIAIGLVVVAVATSAYISGLSTQYAQNDLTRMQESGRFGLQLLSTELKKAGHADYYATPPVFLGQKFGLGMPVGLSAITGVNGASSSNNYSDTLTVRFYGENDLSQPTANVAGGRLLDCLGNAITRDTRVQEDLYVAPDPKNNNEPTLFCQTTYVAGTVAAPACNATSTTCPNPSPLIPGVESMQILYGEDTDGDGIVNHYVPISLVNNTDNVLSVWVSLIVRTTSTSKVSIDTTAKTFNHFGSNYAPGNVAPTSDLGSVYTAPNDQRIRLQFSSLVAVRNF